MPKVCQSSHHLVCFIAPEQCVAMYSVGGCSVLATVTGKGFIVVFKQ